MESLRGKVVIVTGAACGMGKCTSIKFSSLGSNVVLVDLPKFEEKLSGVKSTCVENGLKPEEVLIVTVDLAVDKSRQEVIDRTVQTFGGIDVLVNVAGIIVQVDALDMTEDVFKNLLDVNTIAPYRLSQMAAPYLMKSKGNIINISSVSSTLVNTSIPGYCISKAALDMVTKMMAVRLAPSGVRVNSLNPGHVFGTELLQNNFNWPDTTVHDYEETMVRNHPLGKTSADDIANNIAFLASDLSHRTTGQTIHVCAGFSLFYTKTMDNSKSEK